MEEWKYAKVFKELFADTSVVSSSEITNLVKKMYPRCSAQNAKNVIRTAQKKGVISRVEGIHVEHNSYLYCKCGQEYSKYDIRNLLLKDKKMNAIIHKFLSNEGIISYLDIFKLSGCLISKTTEHSLEIEQIIDKMTHAFSCRREVLEENPFLIDSEKYPEHDKSWITKARSLLVEAKVECMMLRTVIYSLKRQNIMNDVVPLYRNENCPLRGVIYNNMMFDAVGYSSIQAFKGEEYIEKKKNTIVLLDISVNKEYEMENFNGFYERIQIIRNSVKREKRGVIPIVIANNVMQDVKNTCKNMGILVYQLSDFYGNKIEDILKRYRMIVETDKSLEANSNIASIEELLRMIENTGQGDNLENLRGVLFEYFMHSVIYKWLGNEIAGNLITGKKIVFDKEKKISYEYDIIAPLRNEYLVIELKGYANSKYFRWGEKDDTGKMEKETLGWFFRQTFPLARQTYENNPEGKKVRACFITTAHFDPKAKEKLDRLQKSNYKSEHMDIAYDGNCLKEKLKELKMNNEVRVLEQFYFGR